MRNFAFPVLILLAANGLINGRLAAIHYSPQWASNEGSFIALARANLIHNWGPTEWWPYWNGGLPFAFTYPPLLPKATAWLTQTFHADLAHVFHILGAFGLIVGPVTVFVLASYLTRSRAAALAGGLFYSLVSPSAILFPWFRVDAGEMWGVRRLQTLYIYGESPHVVALVFVPLGWAAVLAGLHHPRWWKWLAAAILAIITGLTNSYGIVAFAIGSILALVCSGLPRRAILPAVLATVLAAAVLLPWWPPALIKTLTANGASATTSWPLLIIIPTLALVAVLLRKVPLDIRFPALLFTIFGAMVAVAAIWRLFVIFHAYRYQHEFDMAWALLLAAAWKRYGSRLAIPGALAACGLTFWNAHAAMPWVQQADSKASIEYQASRELARRYPNSRVMASGASAFWLNDFTTLEQLSGGHDPMAINRAQQIAVYTIYTGQNAGAADAEISTIWLKAFGVSAIYVPGVKSREFWKPFANPMKFEGVLPKVWEVEDDRIYEVPGVAGLAYAVPRSLRVNREPIHGLDIAEVRAYVSALRPLSFEWRGHSNAHIAGQLKDGEGVSVQVNHMPGWTATANGQPVNVEKDGIGLIWVDPACTSCEIELRYR